MRRLALSNCSSLVRWGASKFATDFPVSVSRTTSLKGLRVTTKRRLFASSSPIGALFCPSWMGQVAMTLRVFLSTTATWCRPATLIKARLPFCSKAMPSVKSVVNLPSPRRLPVAGEEEAVAFHVGGEVVEVALEVGNVGAAEQAQRLFRGRGGTGEERCREQERGRQGRNDSHVHGWIPSLGF